MTVMQHVPTRAGSTPADRPAVTEPPVGGGGLRGSLSAQGGGGSGGGRSGRAGGRRRRSARARAGLVWWPPALPMDAFLRTWPFGWVGPAETGTAPPALPLPIRRWVHGSSFCGQCCVCGILSKGINGIGDCFIEGLRYWQVPCVLEVEFPADAKNITLCALSDQKFQAIFLSDQKLSLLCIFTR